MARKTFEIPEIAKKFDRKETAITVDGFEIVRGDIIKVIGEYGTKFKFHSFVTNTETGSTWVECFEMFRNMACQVRAFRLDRVKRIPQKGKRAKRVS